VNKSGVFPVDIIPPRLSMLIYHLGMNNIPVCGQFRGTISPHHHHHHHHVSELWPPTDLLHIPKKIYECGEPWWNDIDRGKQ
jgi:hypothetical protein